MNVSNVTLGSGVQTIISVIGIKKLYKIHQQTKL